MPAEKRVKYILVTGGVISGVGKGIITSSLGVLLKNNGYKGKLMKLIKFHFQVTAIKIDPYLNIDAGTFSPYEHGEVFVLDDGGDVDLDLGNFEQFLDIRLTRDYNITTGKMFKHVMEKKRRGDYCGKTVQMIPRYFDGTSEQPDVCIIELRGTNGKIEGMTYLSAFERFQRPTLKNHLMNVHVSLILHPNATGEPKTKPMQNSVRHLRAAGVVPDLLICRAREKLDPHLREKISRFGMMDLEQVVGVHDVSNIYKVPLLLQDRRVLEAIKHRLCLTEVCEDLKKDLYVKIADTYASVNKAFGIIVPGGFDIRGVEGMIKAAEYCRKNNVPYLGVCLGMQVAAVEFARNVLGIKGANSTEFNSELYEDQLIVIDMPEHNVEENGLGGTMRLGRRSTVFLTDYCILHRLYGAHTVEERHRHRYEVNPRVVPQVARNGFLFVGMDYPYFVGAQFHPEYLSHPLTPSPLFFGLLLVATGLLTSYFSGSRSPALQVVAEERSPLDGFQKSSSSTSGDLVGEMLDKLKINGNATPGTQRIASFH
ncbi:hypothetical protein CRE_31370 [Caenorhabditis remanei]|uniref:CTP synthase n=1 Tax=Caenorhabditis remanei TaxID=31234 RepID=E3MY85_CAERE|nr:hypothetical protein CRE_31370 [Caenorhabditis remanei]